MFPGFQSVQQSFLALLLVISLPSWVFGASWRERTDIGVAAVDRRSGKVVWEAWQIEDVPAEVSKSGKAMVKMLLDRSSPSSDSEWSTFPARLANDRVVNYVHDASGSYFVLAHGQPRSIGAEIARFSIDENGRWRYRLSSGTLYCLRNAKVQAFRATSAEDIKNKEWKPAWTYDLLAELPAQEREAGKWLPVDLHVNAAGVWVVHGPRLLQLTQESRKLAQLELQKLRLTMIDHYIGTPLTFGKRLIYYRSTNDVIALDWQKKQEVWRVPTTLSPTLSKVIEIEDGLILIQIGSHVPRSIESALGLARHPIDLLKSNRLQQRIAAARLLHSYGDGYLRKQLRDYREELRKKEIEVDAKKAVAVLDDLLATWPRYRERQRLSRTCVVALLDAKEKDTPPVFGSPASERLLTWCVLQELIYGHTPDGFEGPGYNYAYSSWNENRLSLGEETAAMLAEHCRCVLAKGPEREKGFAASVLLSRTIGWFRLTDAERKMLFLSSQPSVWRWTAMSLVKNGWREELIQWAPERPAGDQLHIVTILSDKMPKKWSKAELKFLLTAARHNAGGVAYMLRLQIEGELPMAFRPAIRDYLEKEIAKPTVKDVDSEGASFVFAALEVLDRWKKSEDTALLRKYLKHPYDRLREHVKVMLEKRGVQQRSSIER